MVLPHHREPDEVCDRDRPSLSGCRQWAGSPPAPAGATNEAAHDIMLLPDLRAVLTALPLPAAVTGTFGRWNHVPPKCARRHILRRYSGRVFCKPLHPEPLSPPFLGRGHPRHLPTPKLSDGGGGRHMVDRLVQDAGRCNRKRISAPMEDTWPAVKTPRSPYLA